MMGRFAAAITSENTQGYVAVIPDIKCISPKEGDMLRGRDPVETAKSLVRWGAPVLSVVTEPKNFGGSFELLRTIADAVQVPVLRKDFITEERALEETLNMGASAVLLICAIVDKASLANLFEKSIQLGIEPFVEVCSEEELIFANELGARLIGVNNRNIKNLELDDGGPARTVSLTPFVPDGALLVSESGILSTGDAKLAASAGVNALLVGTALWLAGDMEAMYRSFRVEWSGSPCAQP